MQAKLPYMMMRSTSKPNGNRKKLKLKLKLVLNPNQQWQVKQHDDDDVDRDWLELPYDITANILHRVGAHDILENAQKVCTDWYKICKDPAMWRVIYMRNIASWQPNQRPRLRKMCKHAVDRSQGQLVDITIVNFGDNDLLEYIADRSSQLRRLEFAYCLEKGFNNWAESLKKFPLLEELSLYVTKISRNLIESAGLFCPMLTTLKINGPLIQHPASNRMAIAIGESLPNLKHLELIGYPMSNIGLQAILDGCGHLELLDLRCCSYLRMHEQVGKKCLEKIQRVKLPNESLEGCPYLDVP